MSFDKGTVPAAPYLRRHNYVVRCPTTGDAKQPPARYRYQTMVAGFWVRGLLDVSARDNADMHPRMPPVEVGFLSDVLAFTS